MQRTWLCVISLMAGMEIGSAQERFVLGQGRTSCTAWTQAHTTNAPERLNMEELDRRLLRPPSMALRTIQMCPIF